jgi:hypothetical protein
MIVDLMAVGFCFSSLVFGGAKRTIKNTVTGSL